MTQLIFRDFAPNDQAPVKALVLAGMAQRYGDIDPSLNPDLNDIHKHYVQQAASFIIVEVAGEMVGCGALILENGSREVGRIVRVSVRADQQRRGYGRQISQRLIEIAEARGFARLLVETNDDWDSALRLYQSLGFVEYKRERSAEFGVVEVHMEKALG